ncbi:MAG: FGGY family carbohydrate kinase [Acidimicrobiales bacterium]
MRALAIDVGSSSVRTSLVDEAGRVFATHQELLTVRSPNPGEVELDPAQIARLSLDLAARTLDEAGPCDAVGVTNQRATTIVFDHASGEAVGPALSWQDLRTVLDCLVLQADGVRLAPNQSATKIKWLVDTCGRAPRDLGFATIETWIAWHLSQGSTFASDRSNAAVTGLVDRTVTKWDDNVLSTLHLDKVRLPSITDTLGSFGVASALAGSPPLTAMIGDQPASLFGQACVKSGTKITFGTGAMLDVIHGDHAPPALHRFPSGCYPTVVRSSGGVATWGVEGIVLSAGSCVQWLRDLGLLRELGDSDEMARSLRSSDGVSFVPAFSGLGTPEWDFGARGAFFGLTRGTSPAHLVRAVLEGVAQRGADLVDAAEEEIGTRLSVIRVDGGMSVNRFFVQRLADFSGHAVAVSSEREATTRGVGLMALVAAGHLSFDDVEALWSPSYVATPSLSDDERTSTRDAWRAVVQRARRTIPELSTVTF